MLFELGDDTYFGQGTTRFEKQRHTLNRRNVLARFLLFESKARDYHVLMACAELMSEALCLRLCVCGFLFVWLSFTAEPGRGRGRG